MSNPDSDGSTRAYVFGHSDRELDHLTAQARLIDAITRGFFRDAGIVSGMRVLDVGSGAGDVAFLAAVWSVTRARLSAEIEFQRRWKQRGLERRPSRCAMWCFAMAIPRRCRSSEPSMPSVVATSCSFSLILLRCFASSPVRYGQGV